MMGTRCKYAIQAASGRTTGTAAMGAGTGRAWTAALAQLSATMTPTTSNAIRTGSGERGRAAARDTSATTGTAYRANMALVRAQVPHAAPRASNMSSRNAQPADTGRITFTARWDAQMTCVSSAEQGTRSAWIPPTTRNAEAWASGARQQHAQAGKSAR